MNATTVRIPPPTVPTAETIADPRYSITDETGDLLITYCPINRAGAIYTFATQHWQVHSRIGFAQFAALCGMAGVRLADCENARLWADTCAHHGTAPLKAGHA